MHTIQFRCGSYGELAVDTMAMDMIRMSQAVLYVIASFTIQRNFYLSKDFIEILL